MTTVKILSDKAHAIIRDIGGIKISRTRARQTDVVNQMYTIEWPESTEMSLSEKLNEMMGTISLFSSEKQEREFKKRLEEAAKAKEKERPQTPINEEITHHPKTLKQLLRYLRRRIKPRVNIQYLTEADQMSLAEVLIGEMHFVWGDMKHRVNDPFLSAKENAEVARRICVYMVTACEELFDYYLSQAKVLHDRMVFTDLANKSRLQAQISLHTHKVLNYLGIRRDALESVKQVRRNGEPVNKEFNPKVLKFRHKQHDGQKERLSGIQLEFDECMPKLDFEGVVPGINDLSLRLHSAPQSESDGASMQDTEGILPPSIQLSIHDRPDCLRLFRKRSASVPLPSRGILKEELNISTSDTLKKSESVFNLSSQHFEDMTHVLEPTKEERVRTDLKNLLTQTKFMEVDMADQEQLPPLLQAITRHQEGSGTKYRTMLKEMEAKDKEKEEAQKSLKKPIEAIPPQPATIARTLPNQMIVKTADIRVSNRVCIASHSLKKYTPLYNDLFEEISTETVKALDKPLYMHLEIQEVYSEIMKSISDSHFEVSNDVLVEFSPPETAWGQYCKKPVEVKCEERGTIINESLIKKEETPWKNRDIDMWCKTPESMMNESSILSFNADMDHMKERILALNDQSSGMNDLPTVMVDKLRRQYDLWLNWWKSNIDPNDYIKFLTLKRTDYLGVIFHLFEDHEMSELQRKRALEESLLNENLAKITAKEKEQLDELREVKFKYEPGMWNAACVFMGGLGNDPAVPKVNTESDIVTESRSTRGPSPRSPRATPATTHSSCPTRSETPKSMAMSIHQAKTIPDWKNSLPDLQKRLDSIWVQLHMPESQKLDMAIKYSDITLQNTLQHSIIQWEYVTRLIVNREECLIKLEKFERHASDPDRFFHKGQASSSVPRFVEATQRAQIQQEIHELEIPIKKEINQIRKRFNDVVTYGGRDYKDKMKSDKLEMLYWLQEERKQNALKYELANKRLSIKPKQLQPLLM